MNWKTAAVWLQSQINVNVVKAKRVLILLEYEIWTDLGQIEPLVIFFTSSQSCILVSLSSSNFLHNRSAYVASIWKRTLRSKGIRRSARPKGWQFDKSANKNRTAAFQTVSVQQIKSSFFLFFFTVFFFLSKSYFYRQVANTWDAKGFCLSTFWKKAVAVTKSKTSKYHRRVQY